MMTTPSQTRPEILQAARDRFFESLPTHFEHLTMGRDQLAVLQTERLRAVLRSALARSSFHRARLGNVDPDTIALDQLASIPPMTKSEMMASYDDVVTDPRLSLEVVNRHLESVGERPEILFDEYVVLSTGGSSGVRGVFACDLEGAAEQMAAVVRGGLAGLAAMTGWPPPDPAPMTIVAAPTCVHATRGLSSTFLPGRLADITYAPVTVPFDRLLGIVQQSQPLILIGYPSVISRLAEAQTSGQLSISPMVVTVTSEQLTADHMERIATGFGVTPTNSYGTSEGLMGTAPAGSDVFEFASDLAYIEFVDSDDNPVALGQTAHHVLVTNLFNHTQPLIRYRIDDTMTPVEPAGDHGHQRATLEGRNDELLTVAGVCIHPMTIRSALVEQAAVADYQVRTRPDGSIEVDLVPAAGAIDVRSLETTLTAALADAGATDVLVSARMIDAVPRDPRTGKTRRFTSD